MFKLNSLRSEARGGSFLVTSYGTRYTASDLLREEAKGKWQEMARFARMLNAQLLIMNGNSLGAQATRLLKPLAFCQASAWSPHFKNLFISMSDTALLPSFKSSMLATTLPHRHEGNVASSSSFMPLAYADFKSALPGGAL